MARKPAFIMQSVLRTNFLAMVLVVPLLITVLLAVTDTHASDRDTPAYRIYVDPETGRYTTTAPADSTATQTQITTLTPAQQTVATGSGTDTRRPFTAVLILTAIAVASVVKRS